MVDLTDAQQWLHTNTRYKSPVTIPAIAPNDIDGAFNCVCHSVLNRIHTHYCFQSCLVKCIPDFNTDRQIHMTFDGEVELQSPLQPGRPQESPLSPILFFI